MDKKPRTPEELKNELQALMPGKTLLVVAFQTLNMEGESPDPEQASQMFALSTISSGFDITQLSIILAKNEDMRQLFTTALASSNALLRDKEMMQKLEDSLVETKNPM